jgi:hypothetical protein
MAYDAARQRVVLYGGQGVGGSYPTSTWEWDGVAWVQSTSTTNPGTRANHTMAYDAARQRVVLFGGSVIPLSPFADDTWEWDGATWVLRSVAVRPPGRQQGKMACDSVRQRTVLFGGLGAGFVHLGDTWEWDGVAWQQRVPSQSPAARSDHAMAYDESRQSVVLFGGTSISFGQVIYGDTWEWNGTDWVQSNPAVRPSGRLSHTMAFDSAQQTVILFSGSAPTGASGDTWATYVAATAAAYGSGCGAPPLAMMPEVGGRPLLGQIASATITNAPLPAVGVAMGLSNTAMGPTPLPFPLDSIGMTGCLLQQSTELLGLGVTPLGGTSYRFQQNLPNQPALLGLRLFLQAYALAPGQNPLEVIASNGIAWRIGNV